MAGNPIDSALQTAIEQGNEALIRYYERQQRDTQKETLYEAKILLVGRTGAGKTSLMYKLKHKDKAMPEPDESTAGIDVEQISYKMANGKHFRMNVWDFEGQAISHQTHQFFLTQRSLYVFVADNRTEKVDTDYWFQIVELLGRKSPMLILHNEKQGSIAGMNQQALEKRFGDFLLPNQYRADLEAIAKGKKFSSRHFSQFTTFTKELKKTLETLPIVGTKLEKSWVDVRRVIEKLAKSKATIPASELWAICKEQGVPERDQQDLSSVFHDLGVFLHFQNEKEEAPSLLSKMVILQNEWATKADDRYFDHKKIFSGIQNLSSGISQLKNQANNIDKKLDKANKLQETILNLVVEHKNDLLALHSKLDDLSATQLSELENLLDKRLSKLSQALPSTDDFAKKWAEINAKGIHNVDSKLKAKIKLDLYFFALEKEFAVDMKPSFKAFKKGAQDILAWRRGEKKFADIFWEDTCS